MTKKSIPPSRQHYVDENPTISCRVPLALKEQLEKYLAASGQSFADFVKSTLEAEKSLVNERVNVRVEQRFGTFKDRVTLIDSLMWQFLITLDENNLPVLCPRCEGKGDYRLFRAWSHRPGPDGKPDELPTWKCRKCGWFYDIEGQMDPSYLKWEDPSVSVAELKDKPSLPKKQG